MGSPADRGLSSYRHANSVLWLRGIGKLLHKLLLKTEVKLPVREPLSG